MRSTQCAALPVVMQCAKTLGIEPASVRGLASASSKATNVFLSTSTFSELDANRRDEAVACVAC